MSKKALKLIEYEKMERTGMLNLFSCGLTQLPKEIIKLTWLKKLVISDNQIQDIAPLQYLTQLIELDISKNNINDASPLQHLKQLTTLEIYTNKIGICEKQQCKS